MRIVSRTGGRDVAILARSCYTGDLREGETMAARPTVQKVSCASCGASLAAPGDADHITCGFCGSTLAIRRGDGYIASVLAEQVKADIRAVGNTLGARLDRIGGALESEAASALKCPRCGRTDVVSKVAAVAQGGTTRTTAGGAEQLVQTELARSLTCPPARFAPKVFSDKGWLFQAGAATLVAVIAPFVIINISRLNPGRLVVAGWIAACEILAALLLLWAVIGHVRRRRAFAAAQEAARWTKARAWRVLYDQLYYCARCDRVFHPTNANFSGDRSQLALLLDRWSGR